MADAVLDVEEGRVQRAHAVDPHADHLLHRHQAPGYVEATTGEVGAPGRSTGPSPGSPTRRGHRRRRELGEVPSGDPVDRLLIGGFRHLRGTSSRPWVAGPWRRGRSGRARSGPPVSRRRRGAGPPSRDGDEPTTSSRASALRDGKLDADIGEMTTTTQGEGPSEGRPHWSASGHRRRSTRPRRWPRERNRRGWRTRRERRRRARREANRADRTPHGRRHPGARHRSRDPQATGRRRSDGAERPARRGRSCRPGAWSWRPRPDGSSTAAWQSSTGARAMAGATV